MRLNQNVHSMKVTCFVLMIVAAVDAGAAAGQAQGTANRTGDYYQAASTPQSMERLKVVEAFHLEPGMQRMKEKNYRSALNHFEFILGHFPNHPKVLSLVSELCDVNWKSPQCDAESYFPRALEINPNASQTHVIYGLHLQRRKNLDKAVISYHRALEINPASSNAHYNLGLAYFDQRRFDPSNQHAQAAYALGFPLQGLKEKLTRSGQWRPLPEADVQRMTTRPETEPTSPK